MEPSAKQPEAIEAHLGLWDAVSIIVGIIIGVGIFVCPADVFGKVSHPATAIALWIGGGALALIGALCFAELASAYPRSGGEYVYLTRAFGPLTGFLFAWSQLTVTRTGSIAVLAYVFGSKAASLFGDYSAPANSVLHAAAVGLMASPSGQDAFLAGSFQFVDSSELLADPRVFLLAGLSVLVLTVINILGVRMGPRTQNILTVAKLLGLIALIVVGFGWGRGEVTLPAKERVQEVGWLAGAMILILWTYSGWHEAAYIVAEAKNHTRNIPLALVLGTTLVTGIYLLVNVAYLYALDFQGAKNSNAAAELARLAWPEHGGRAMNVLIMISALGAMNGMIFTSARIYSEFGTDHRLFKVLSHWSKRWKTPTRAIIIQCIICLAMIAGVWLMQGGRATFEAAVALTAAVFWMFFLLTGASLLILRTTDPDTPRPFRVPGYPLVPLVFCLWCGYMVIGTVLYDPFKSLIGLGVLVAGMPFYFLPQKLKQRQHKGELQPLAK